VPRRAGDFGSEPSGAAGALIAQFAKVRGEFIFAAHAENASGAMPSL
jgi:hypothetical protein